MTAVLKLNQYPDLQSLEEELQAYEAMTEEEAMDFYKVDSKDEALTYITEFWE